jgi:hypothetical protein
MLFSNVSNGTNAEWNARRYQAHPLHNYIKPIKLYCKQMDIQILWKKIMRGMPRGRRYANDRAPTLEEIKKILVYPDRWIIPTSIIL